MAPSLISVRNFNAGETDGTDVSSANTLSELIELVPGPFQPRMKQVINSIYGSAVKANHVRSYLSMLGQKKNAGEYPTEIEGRIQLIKPQISKEFSGHADWKEAESDFQKTVKEQKDAVLVKLTTVKEKELKYLQDMLVESNYDELTKAILNEVTLEVCKDAGIEPVTADGSIDKTVLPAFFKSDFDRFDEHRNLLASRSIAIAYITIARELSSKMKNLAVKKKADEDTQMGGTESTNKTVQQVVQEEIRKMLPDQQKKSVKPNAGRRQTGRVTKRGNPPKRKASNPPQKGRTMGGGKGKGNGKKKSPRN